MPYHLVKRAPAVLLGTLLIANTAFAPAQTVSVPLAQAPLMTLSTAPGLVMLTMGRDLSLSRAAYNDVNDIDGDGIPDAHFKPNLTYDGYFASDRCYSYSGSGSSAMFQPKSLATLSGGGYRCSTGGTSSTWNGNYLNWLSMARIDVIRKVLYGGKRSTDTATSTILERTYVPQDATAWGKEYTSTANDGYDIGDFTPLRQPTSGTRHVFGNVTPVYASSSSPTNVDTHYAAPNDPILVVLQNQTNRVWDLITTDVPVMGKFPATQTNPNAAYTVRVKTCVALSGNVEKWCTPYPVGAASPTSYKPTGVLQKYGGNGTLAFGLLTGSHDSNYAGGVLRKNMDDFAQEVNAADGTFNASAFGVVYHLDTMRPWGFGSDGGGTGNDNIWNCRYRFAVQRSNGDCSAWGNPLGEMMYETLNYFAGGSPSSAYATGPTSHTITIAGGGTRTVYSPEPAPSGTIASLNLKQPAWINPYMASSTRARTAAFPTCSRPTQIVIGNPSTSFDSDQLPGAYFGVSTGFGSSLPPSSGSLATLDVSAEADAIWAAEFGAGATKQFFIGESGTNADGNPSAKSVSSFKNIRGHAPNDSGSQGSFYGASVARYGKRTGVVNGGAARSVDQFSIALDSHVPQISIPVSTTAGNKTVVIVPLSKTISGTSGDTMSMGRGDWQITDAITSFFIDNIYNVNGYPTNAAMNGGNPRYIFHIDYSNEDQGSDNDRDAKITYTIDVLTGGKLQISLQHLGGQNGTEMRMGYVISGTTADGLYLDIGAASASLTSPFANATSKVYFLDTAPGIQPGGAMTYGTGPKYLDIPTVTSTGTTLKVPTTTVATPRTFTVNTSSAVAASYVPHDMLWYAAKHGHASYRADGSVLSYRLDKNDNPETYFYAQNPSMLMDQIGQAFQKAASLALASTTAAAGTGNKIAGDGYIYQASFEGANWSGEVRALAYDASGNVSGAATWLASSAQPSPASRTMVLGRGGVNTLNMTPSSFTSLSASEQANFKNDTTFQYLTGVRTQEAQYGGTLRTRGSALGDITNSDPVYLSTNDFGYTDTSYAAFASSTNPQAVAVGSNDGFYRILDAVTGKERLAFLPLAVQSDISKLADPGYIHQYYVDGGSTFGHVRNSSAWRAVVAATPGAGGKSVFAVNVGTSASSAPNVLWEYTDSDIGNIINKPVVGNLQDSGSTGVVLVGNGLNSANGLAALVVINALTGKKIQTCTPSNVANSTGNGMTSISFVASTSGRISYVYAGDYYGNIWRIDPNDTGCSTNAELIFSAVSPSGYKQPITGELTVVPAPSGKTGNMVLFGTGSFITMADPKDASTQTLYGIWDDLSLPFSTVARSQLVAQAFKFSGSSLRTSTSRADVNGGKAWFQTSQRGWFLDLPVARERHIGKPLVVTANGSQSVVFLTLVPGSDSCAPSGGAWTTFLDPLSGESASLFTAFAENSAYVDGSSGKGMFLLPKRASQNSPGVFVLLVARNFISSTANAGAGIYNNTGVITAADGSGTAQAALDLAKATTTNTSPPRYRQVWRQLQ